MPSPHLGATATEVVAALTPLLQQTASRDDLRALTVEFHALNGSVTNLQVWQGKVEERHRTEDSAPPPPPPPSGPTPSRLTVKETLLLLFGVALVSGGATAGVLELLKVLAK